MYMSHKIFKNKYVFVDILENSELHVEIWYLEYVLRSKHYVSEDEMTRVKG